MAIQTTYNFKGITIPNAYIRVARIWGSSKEGWTALVEACVDEEYTTPAIPAKYETKVVTPATDDAPEVTEQALVSEEVPETTATRKVAFDTFNISAGYVVDERGYASIYKALQAKFPDGVDV